MSHRRSEHRGRERRPAPPALPPHLDDALVAELAEVAEGAGCELVHAELKGGTLRLFIDRPDGVDLADCETISRQVSALLDVVDFGSGRYLLEVSSPGLDRQLYRPHDWERFVGRRVRVTFRSPETGKKRTVAGLLVGFTPEAAGGGQATVVEEPGGERLALPLDDIQVGRLEIEL